MPWADVNPSMGPAVQRLVSSSPIPYATTPFAQPSMPMPQMAPQQYQAPQQQVPDYASMMQSMLGGVNALQAHRSTNTEGVNGAMGPQPPTAPGVAPPTPAQPAPPPPPDRSQVLLAQLNSQGPNRGFSQGISAAGINYGTANNVNRDIPRQ